MYDCIDTSAFPCGAQNLGTELLYKDEKLSLYSCKSKNDEGVTRKKVFLERNIHKSIPVDVVIVLARVMVDGIAYNVLTRQWREPTGQYSIGFPAGVYDENKDKNPTETGLRELQEETPFTATREDVREISSISYSSDGCLSETFQMLQVDAKHKEGTRLLNGIAEGSTNQTKTESICTLYVPEDKLYPTLMKLQKNHSIDGRLMAFAIGKQSAIKVY